MENLGHHILVAWTVVALMIGVLHAVGVIP